MFQKFLIASAATLLAAATIATSASAQGPAPAQKQAAAKKYCIQYHETVGTRIAKSECKTKAQWANEGVDVDKLLRN